MELFPAELILKVLKYPSCIIHVESFTLLLFFCVRCKKLLKGSTGNYHHSSRRGKITLIRYLFGFVYAALHLPAHSLFSFRSSLFLKTLSLACSLRSLNLLQTKCVVSYSVCPLSVKMEPCRYSVKLSLRHKWTHSRFLLILRPWLRSRPLALWGGFTCDFLQVLAVCFTKPPTLPTLFSVSPLGSTGNLCSKRCYSNIPEPWEQVSATHSQLCSCTVRKSLSTFHLSRRLFMLNHSLIILNSTPQNNKVKTQTFLQIP